MTKKLVSKPLSFTRSFNQSRQIRHDKASAIRNLHHPQIRSQRCKVVFRDFRFRLGYNGQQCGFPNRWEANQSDIRQHLQFDHNITFFPRCAQLTVLRCRVFTGFKVEIAAAALSALGDDFLLSLACEIRQNSSGFLILYKRTLRHLDNAVCPIGTMHFLCLSVPARLCSHLAVVAQIQQCCLSFIDHKNDITASPAVSAAGTTVGNIFFTPESNDSISAFSSLHMYFYTIYKHSGTSLSPSVILLKNKIPIPGIFSLRLWVNGHFFLVFT